jgi:hypothetical protein
MMSWACIPLVTRVLGPRLLPKLNTLDSQTTSFTAPSVGGLTGSGRLSLQLILHTVRCRPGRVTGKYQSDWPVVFQPLPSLATSSRPLLAIIPSRGSSSIPLLWGKPSKPPGQPTYPSLGSFL